VTVASPKNVTSRAALDQLRKNALTSGLAERLRVRSRSSLRSDRSPGLRPDPPRGLRPGLRPASLTWHLLAGTGAPAPVVLVADRLVCGTSDFILQGRRIVGGQLLPSSVWNERYGGLFEASGASGASDGSGTRNGKISRLIRSCGWSHGECQVARVQGRLVVSLAAPRPVSPGHDRPAVRAQRRCL
jgi:hypothetical protein